MDALYLQFATYFLPENNYISVIYKIGEAPYWLDIVRDS